MSAQASATKFRVLLVEENAAMARFILDSLGAAGMQCYQASDGQGAMEQFRQHDPHLVLLSLGLPRVGGAALCPQVRAVSCVPIIIISMRTRREDHLHALNIGADDFIVMKPADEQLFLARVLTLLRRTYRYDREPISEVPDPNALPAPRGPAPTGWVTCEACGYIGPGSRFKKVDASSNHKMVCPHCNQDQNLKFTVA